MAEGNNVGANVGEDIGDNVGDGMGNDCGSIITWTTAVLMADDGGVDDGG